MNQMALRVRAVYGDLPVVIAQVTGMPVQECRVCSPRLTPSADEAEMSMDEIVAEVHRHRQEKRLAEDRT